MLCGSLQVSVDELGQRLDCMALEQERQTQQRRQQQGSKQLCGGGGNKWLRWPSPRFAAAAAMACVAAASKANPLFKVVQLVPAALLLLPQQRGEQG